jgi:T4 RnlA family RNA ligase
MKNFIPTYEQCQEIVKASDGVFFQEREFIIDGFKICVFNYRLAPYEMFIHPIEGNSEIDARELRGLTFVFNEDGTYKRFLMLKKFWNVGQVKETQINILENKKIKTIFDKLDGSCIHFIQLPNGKVIAKSKNSFDFDGVGMANNEYNNNTKIKNLVDWSIKNDIQLIFEIVSPQNKIVINYSETKLILLRARKNDTGEFISFEDLDYDLSEIEIPVREYFNSIHEMLDLKETQKNKEGWIIEFEDGELSKVKTEEYFLLHNILTVNINREDFIIKMIVDETIDDFVSQLREEDTEMREMISRIELVVVDFIKRKSHEVKGKYDLFVGEYKSDKKAFAISQKKDDIFHLVMSHINYNHDIIKMISDLIIDKTYFLEDARYFVKNGEIRY